MAHHISQRLKSSFLTSLEMDTRTWKHFLTYKKILLVRTRIIKQNENLNFTTFVVHQQIQHGPQTWPTVSSCALFTATEKTEYNTWSLQDAQVIIVGAHCGKQE